MKNQLSIFTAFCAILFFACNSKTSNSEGNVTHADSARTDKERMMASSANNGLKEAAPSSDVVFSFAFVGCNRVQRGDRNNTEATNASSANVAVLKRIFSDVLKEKRLPDLFFFLGDLVYAESTTSALNSELEAWKKQFTDPTFSNINKSNIEMVAIPGNHEMLSWAEHPQFPNHDEWPLKGATEIWMKYMADYMPKDRDSITGPDAVVNKMTFAFTRANVGFICMNTDTYNPPTKQNPYGYEGKIPTDWILNKVDEYKKDSTIDHVFILGHKPCYLSVDGLDSIQTGHAGIPEAPELWPKIKAAEVLAMLSAHEHDYQRMQPGGQGTYQVIAGNGGSKGSAEFFGYSIINIMADGSVQLISKGFDKGHPYYTVPAGAKTTVRDSTIMTWTTNANPYEGRN